MLGLISLKVFRSRFKFDGKLFCSHVDSNTMIALLSWHLQNLLRSSIQSMASNWNTSRLQWGRALDSIKMCVFFHGNSFQRNITQNIFKIRWIHINHSSLQVFNEQKTLFYHPFRRSGSKTVWQICGLMQFLCLVAVMKLATLAPHLSPNGR